MAEKTTKTYNDYNTEIVKCLGNDKKLKKVINDLFVNADNITTKKFIKRYPDVFRFIDVKNITEEKQPLFKEIVDLSYINKGSSFENFYANLPNSLKQNDTVIDYVLDKSKNNYTHPNFIKTQHASELYMEKMAASYCNENDKVINAYEQIPTEHQDGVVKTVINKTAQNEIFDKLSAKQANDNLETIINKVDNVASLNSFVDKLLPKIDSKRLSENIDSLHQNNRYNNLLGMSTSKENAMKIYNKLTKDTKINCSKEMLNIDKEIYNNKKFIKTQDNSLLYIKCGGDYSKVSNKFAKNEELIKTAIDKASEIDTDSYDKKLSNLNAYLTNQVDEYIKANNKKPTPNEKRIIEENYLNEFRLSKLSDIVKTLNKSDKNYDTYVEKILGTNAFKKANINSQRYLLSNFDNKVLEKNAEAIKNVNPCLIFVPGKKLNKDKTPILSEIKTKNNFVIDTFKGIVENKKARRLYLNEFIKTIPSKSLTEDFVSSMIKECRIVCTKTPYEPSNKNDIIYNLVEEMNNRNDVDVKYQMSNLVKEAVVINPYVLAAIDDDKRKQILTKGRKGDKIFYSAIIQDPKLVEYGEKPLRNRSKFALIRASIEKAANNPQDKMDYDKIIRYCLGLGVIPGTMLGKRPLEEAIDGKDSKKIATLKTKQMRKCLRRLAETNPNVFLDCINKPELSNNHFYNKIFKKAYQKYQNQMDVIIKDRVQGLKEYLNDDVDNITDCYNAIISAQNDLAYYKYNQLINNKKQEISDSEKVINETNPIVEETSKKIDVLKEQYNNGLAFCDDLVMQKQKLLEEEKQYLYNANTEVEDIKDKVFLYQKIKGKDDSFWTTLQDAVSNYDNAQTEEDKQTAQTNLNNLGYDYSSASIIIQTKNELTGKDITKEIDDLNSQKDKIVDTRKKYTEKQGKLIEEKQNEIKEQGNKNAKIYTDLKNANELLFEKENLISINQKKIDRFKNIINDTNKEIDNLRLTDEEKSIIDNYNHPSHTEDWLKSRLDNSKAVYTEKMDKAKEMQEQLKNYKIALKVSTENQLSEKEKQKRKELDANIAYEKKNQELIDNNDEKIGDITM